MNIRLAYFLALLFFISCSKSDDSAMNYPIKTPVTTAQYKVNFEFNWNKTDFPTDYPSSAHFSPLVGWVHQPKNDYFSVGKIASDGIEIMAETGATSTLVDELQAFVARNLGLSVYTGSGLGSGVGSISIQITVSNEYPSVTLATMIAPSPDWYVACVDENLLEGDNFVTQRMITGIVYDAGTDDGTSFTSNNQDTSPKAPISLLKSLPLGDGNTVKPTFCTITFEKQ